MANDADSPDEHEQPDAQAGKAKPDQKAGHDTLLANSAKFAAAGASAGTGFGFSYVLFDKMKVADLLGDGSIFGLTVFAVVAVIVIAAAYATLPTKDNKALNRVFVGIIVLFAGLGVAGFAFEIIVQSIARPVIIKATFAPDIQAINKRLRLADDSALSVMLDDHHNHRKVLAYESDVSLQVANDWELTLNLERLDRLPDVLSRKTDKTALDAQCQSGCEVGASGGDDVGQTP